MSFVLLFLNMHVLPIYAKCIFLQSVYLLRAWHPQVGLPSLYSGMEKPRWSYCHFHSCMMISIMLVDSPSVGYRNTWPKVGPLFGKEKLFYQNKKVLWKPWEGYSRPEWVYKMELLWRSMVLENVFGWKKVLIKQHMVLCNYPLQHHRATTLPWGGMGLSL